MNLSSEIPWHWEEMPLAEREKEYSPSSCIEDIEPYISAYITESEEARKKLGEGKEYALSLIHI